MAKQIQNFYKSTILLDWTIGIGNFYVTSKPTITDGWLVVSPNNTALREIVKYTNTGTDANGDYITISERGVGGTSEQTHSLGEPIRMNITAEYWKNMNDAIDAIVASGAPNADTDTKGLVEIATDAEIIAGTDTGSTGAKLTVIPSRLNTQIDSKINTHYSSLGNPIVINYTPSMSTRYGDNSSQFDVTNPSGTTWRYTWDGVGTNPNINGTTFPVDKKVVITGQTASIALNNQGLYTIIGSGTNYFEVSKATGTVEVDIDSVYLYVITDTFTWTKPTGLKYIEVEVQGASDGVPSAGDSTGAGGYSKKIYLSSELSATESVVVGFKGYLQSDVFPVTPASSSIFKSITANPSVDNVGGSSSGGDINISGGNGLTNTGVYGIGGSSILGIGGLSRYDAVRGTGYGSGVGCGSDTGDSGASGVDGIVIIKEFF